MQPAALEDRVGRLLVAVVALEDVRAAHQHLAVVGDLDLGAGQRAPDAADPDLVERVQRRRGARLGHPVALEHGHAAGVEELDHLGADRRRAGDQHRVVGAERVADLRERELVADGVAGLVDRADRAALALGLGHLLARGQRAREDRGLGAARGRGGADDARVDLLQQPRHGRDVRRLGLGDVGREVLRVAAPEGQRAAGLERDEGDHPRQHVRQRQVLEDHRRLVRRFRRSM